MSTSIDNRVVEMRFDNKQFENGVSTTMSTLEKLKESLKFKGATEGFENIAKASGNVDMSGMEKSIETVKTKFSALEVVAVTALANITNSAVNAGVQLVKSLSVDNIAAGWSKYDQKTGSVQTIMNSTGKSIEEVNGYLDRLMWFSDETSYSFTDMTAALAQMTSAGGDIDKLIPMITGIANATAFAGKGAAEFGRTIYNLSQSYSAGFLQAIDMKSLNLAGTSSKQLKETFIEVGESLGKIEKGAVTIENFDASLKDMWADTEVMEIALGKFSALSEAAYTAVEKGDYDTASEAIEALADDYDDLSVKAFRAAQEAKSFKEAIESVKDAVSSGWLETFELIFGNYEEAKRLWTDLANTLWDVFAAGGEERNEMLSLWKELGGRDSFVNAFWNILNNLVNIMNAVKSAFRSVFPKKTAEQWLDITQKVEKFTEKILLSEEQLSKFEHVLTVIFSVFKTIGSKIGNILKSIWSIGKNLFAKIKSGEIINDISKLFNTIKTAVTNFFTNFIKNLQEFPIKIKDAFKKGFDSLKSNDIFNAGYNAVKGFVDGVAAGIKKVVDSAINIGKKFIDGVKKY